MSVFDEARDKINKGGDIRNGPVSEHGVLTVSLSLLAIAEAINGLTETIKPVVDPVRYVGGQFDSPES